MAKEFFVDIKFKKKSLVLIKQAEKVLNEMQARGFTLTVRQLYYQFVARGWLANKQRNYQRLASVIDDARKAGLIDWDAIEDRERYLRSWRTFENPASAVAEAARAYMEDVRQDQEIYLEAWVEKSALLGVIEPACQAYRIPYFACRGYASSSSLHDAGLRFRRMESLGKRCIILHLGDHDPSGLDMTRVNYEAGNLYAASIDVEIRRLALNIDQVEEYNPPPNPAKETDSRFAEYAAQHGESSWELDALDPDVIDKLIREAAEKYTDMDLYNAAKARELENENRIKKVADNWDRVQKFLNKKSKK